MSLLAGLLGATFRAVMFRRRAAFARDLAAPETAQRRRLAAILAETARTTFGREQNLRPELTPDVYRRTLPIRTYADFSPYINRAAAGETEVLTPGRPLMFSLTSGTTAEPKLCPVTRSFVLEAHSGHLLWLRQSLADHPHILNGSYLSVISPAESFRTAGGIPAGASSGRQYLDQAAPIRAKHAVPYAAFAVADAGARYHAILAFALARPDVTVATSVNPSTLVLLAEILTERGEALLADLERGELTHPALRPEERAALAGRLRVSPERVRVLRERLKADGRLTPATVWPELTLINCWHGGNAPFYLRRLAPAWGQTPRRCLGLRASEGTFSIPLADGTDAGVLAVGGHFLEFLPAEAECRPESRTLLAHELERGRLYRLIITTSAGLLRYDLADLVEVTGFRDRTPEVAFRRKAGGVLSLTGEKVTEDQVVAVLYGLSGGFPPLAGFTVTLELTAAPRYVLAVEPGAGWSEAELRRLALEFDRALRAANEEYDGKRASLRLGAPLLLELAPGAYRAHRAALAAAGRPDGQIKPPHLIQLAGEGPAPRPECPFFSRVTVVRRLEPEAKG